MLLLALADLGPQAVQVVAHAQLLPESQLEGVKVAPRALAKSFEAPLATLENALVGLGETSPETNAKAELISCLWAMWRRRCVGWTS